MEAIYKYRNGERIKLTEAEAAAKLAEWEEVNSDANKKKRKKELVKKMKNSKLSSSCINENNAALVADAILLLSKYITITDTDDETKFNRLKDSIKKLCDIKKNADDLADAIDSDPDTDIESGWPS